jgi:hypothetical protein
MAMSHPYPTRIACANIEEKLVRVTVQIHDMPALGLTCTHTSASCFSLSSSRLSWGRVGQISVRGWTYVHNHTYFLHECTPTAVIYVGVFVIRELKDDMRFDLALTRRNHSNLRLVAVPHRLENICNTWVRTLSPQLVVSSRPSCPWNYKVPHATL